MDFDENLLCEVLWRLDGRTLARSSCVSRIFNRAAQDERLWQQICERHRANIGCSEHQLRSVAFALGGFRRLHSLYLGPISNPNPQGKDELKLSLSLLLIRNFEG